MISEIDQIDLMGRNLVDELLGLEVVAKEDDLPGCKAQQAQHREHRQVQHAAVRRFWKIRKLENLIENKSLIYQKDGWNFNRNRIKGYLGQDLYLFTACHSFVSNISLDSDNSKKDIEI